MKRAFLLILLIGSVATAGEHVRTTRSLDWLVKHPVIVRMHESQNGYRKHHGLTELKLNADLCLMAQRHAAWMAESGAYQHSNYNVAENIHHMVIQPEDAMRDWYYSPAHHANMLGGYRECGCGYMTGPNGARWVMLFR